jgi:hypothetical protein
MTMHSTIKRLTFATALFLAVGLVWLQLPVTFAESSGAPSVLPQQTGAILTTSNNQPILVNGSSTIGGATVMTGAALETPDQVSASLNFPRQFTLNMSPKTSVTVEFGPNSIRVNLIKGCVVLHTKKGTTGEIDTSQGVAGKADGSKDSRLSVCDPSIAAPPVPAPAAVGGGLGGGAASIAAAGVLTAELIPMILGGSNISPRTP